MKLFCFLNLEKFYPRAIAIIKIVQSGHLANVKVNTIIPRKENK